MSAQQADRLSRYSQPAGQEWRRGGYAMAKRPRSGGMPWGLILGGAAVVGLGILAWNYIGPDLRRYMKIRDM